MTVLYTNTFTGSNGSAPSDFTLSTTGTAGTTDIQSNQLRTATGATAFSGQRLILPSGNWNQADGQATVTFTTQPTVDSMLPEIHLRTTGDWDAGESDSATNCYKVIWNPAGNIEVYKRIGGTDTQLGSGVSLTLAGSTTYTMVLKCQGTTILAKLYTGADPGFQITATDASIAGPGQFQMCLLNTTAAVRDVRWDDVSLDDLAVAATGTPAVRPARRRTGA